MAYTLGLHKETLALLRNKREKNKSIKFTEAEQAFHKKIIELHTESQQHKTEEAFLTAMLSHATVFLFTEAISNENKSNKIEIIDQITGEIHNG